MNSKKGKKVKVENCSPIVNVFKKSEGQLKKKFDEFLDNYSVYQDDKSFLPESILKRSIIEIEILDPNFDFNLDD